MLYWNTVIFQKRFMGFDKVLSSAGRMRQYLDQLNRYPVVLLPRKESFFNYKFFMENNLSKINPNQVHSTCK